MDIRQLVEGATAGDQRAWKQLSARLWPRLRAWFAARVSCCDSDVLVQDTLIVMWKKLPELELRSEAAFMSWTFKVANFAALAALRQLEREEALIERLGMLVRTPSPRLSSRLDRAERIELILRELDKLPWAERRAVENMLDGGTARDLAALADIEWSSARALETRVRARLRRRFSESTPPR
jgi:DNA-directed RNA polymerase specialized sigma24 family protein